MREAMKARLDKLGTAEVMPFIGSVFAVGAFRSSRQTSMVVDDVPIMLFELAPTSSRRRSSIGPARFGVLTMASRSPNKMGEFRSQRWMSFDDSPSIIRSEQIRKDLKYTREIKRLLE